MKDPSAAQLASLRRSIERRMGLRADSRGMAELEVLVRRRARILRAPDPGTYVEWVIQGSCGEQEAAHLAAALTVPETYFFRNGGQLRAVERELERRAASGRPVQVLSAGCATGEEAYTVAMLAIERLGPEPPVSILGVDLSRSALEAARRARYPDWSLRQTDALTRARYFVDRHGAHEVVEPVRRLVRFEERNLAADDDELWWPGRFDLVLCRNVLMYMCDAAAHAAVGRMARALAPGGLLILGDAESLRGPAQLPELEHERGERAFFYRRVWPATPQPAPEPVTPKPAAPPPPAPRPLARPPASPAPAASLSAVLDLFRAERFDEALERLDEVADPAAPAAVLLRGVLLFARGELDAAEASGERLLELDRLDPLAHHLIALCREQRQDVAGAIEHERAAIYLEPRFALPHLHMGRLLVREGKRRLARRELSRAADLLADEDDRRFTLFAGGLHRSDLIELCRAEIRRLGAPP